MTSNNKSSNKNEGFWTPLRIVLTLLVFALIAATGISSCTSSDEKTSSVANKSANNAPRARPNNGAPATNGGGVATVALPANVRDATLHTVGGETIKLSDYSGKVLLVNLWATWCGPCRLETPELVKLHKQFQSQGVEMVGLSTENPEASADSVKSFVQAFQVDYHVGWAPPEVAIAFMQMTQRDAIPQSFIISRDGHILKQFVGFNPTYTPPQIKQAIEDALN
jgi:peroxiredoxin